MNLLGAGDSGQYLAIQSGLFASLQDVQNVTDVITPIGNKVATQSHLQ